MKGSASGTRQIRAVSGNAIPAAFGLQDAFRRRGILRELFGRAARAAHQLAAAVRAFPREHVGRAAFAECALERADERTGGVTREVRIAAFAVGSELEHR